MRAVLLTIWILALADCAPPSTAPNGGLDTPIERDETPTTNKTPARFVNPAAPDKDRINYEGKFDPNQTTIKCKSGLNCPTAVGVLLFALPVAEDGKHIPLKMCTATLIADDKILTAEHCDNFKTATDVYFITRSDIPGGKRISRIVKVDYNEFLPAQDPKLASGFPDIAIMSLAEPIKGLKPIALASGAPVDLPSLEAWVIQKGEDKTPFEMTLDQIKCVVHMDGNHFPYKLSEGPRVLRAFDCTAQGGNSGSALLYNGAIEAVLDARAETVKGERQNILATNVHCIDYPAQNKNKCIQPSDDDIHARKQALLDRAFADFGTQKPKPVQAGATFSFMSYKYQILNEKDRYEVFTFPTCHGETWDKKTIPIYTRIGYISYDDWNMPRMLFEGDKTLNTGAVTGGQDNSYSANWTWNQPLLKIEGNGTDPRSVYTGYNGIAIPPCPR